MPAPPRRQEAAPSPAMLRRAAVPPHNDYGKSLDDALAGCAYGCLSVGIVSGVMGAWPLFFAYPAVTVYLALSALLAAAATAALAWRWTRPLSRPAIMTVAATLTFLLFAFLPLYVCFGMPGRLHGLPLG